MQIDPDLSLSIITHRRILLRVQFVKSAADHTAQHGVYWFLEEVLGIFQESNYVSTGALASRKPRHRITNYQTVEYIND